MRDNLEAAIVHEPIVQKLSVFKLCHPALDAGPSWYVVDVPAGIVVARRYSWADALESAAHYLRAAIAPEVCA